MSEEKNWPGVELFDAISKQAVEAAGVKVGDRVSIKDLSSVGLPREVLLIDSDGKHSRLEKPDPKRAHNLHSCKDVIRFVKTSNLFDDPQVWIDHNAIFITDDSERFRGDFATYPLEFTSLYKTIDDLGDSEFVQSEFLSLLRIDLARAFKRDDDRLALIKQVRSVIKRESSSIGKGSGSYEVGVVNEQNQVVEWRDSLLLATTVFNDPDFASSTYEVEVILDVRPENRTSFVLKPVPADLDRAVREAKEAMRAFIETEIPDVNVFLGSPW